MIKVLSPQVKELKKENIIGKSKYIEEIKYFIKIAAVSDNPVLIEGETGTGKELVARAIHSESSRRKGPYITHNCACIQPTLMESEFFGYKRGAFTGATRDKEGLFEAAHKGTLFLDEICDLEPSIQPKFLRVLENGEVYRLGTTTPRKVDVRLITASSKNLKEEIRTKRFREELYFRLKVHKIYLPPLRDRREDIPLLAECFLKKHKKKKNIKGFTKKAIEFLVNREWPGNVRELETTIQRAIDFTSEGKFITLKELSEPVGEGMKAFKIKSLRTMREEWEKGIIYEVLIQHNWSVDRTAKVLKIDSATLYRKIRRYRIKIKAH